MTPSPVSEVIVCHLAIIRWNDLCPFSPLNLFSIDTNLLSKGCLFIPIPNRSIFSYFSIFLFRRSYKLPGELTAILYVQAISVNIHGYGCKPRPCFYLFRGDIQLEFVNQGVYNWSCGPWALYVSQHILSSFFTAFVIFFNWWLYHKVFFYAYPEGNLLEPSLRIYPEWFAWMEPPAPRIDILVLDAFSCFLLFCNNFIFIYI